MNSFFHLTEISALISSKVIHVLNVKKAGSIMEESVITSLPINHPGRRAEMNVELKEETWLR